MSWKSTITITREEAIRLIISQILPLSDKTDEELATMLEECGFGEDSELEYYGYNFIVTDNLQ